MSATVSQHQAAARLQRLNLVLASQPDLYPQLEPQIRECEAAINDPRRPSQHESHAPLPGGFVQPIFAPDCYLVVANIPAVAPGGAASTPRVLEFKSGPGLIIGMRGTVLDNTPGAEAAGRLEMASIGVQATWNNGRTNIITNGENPDYIRYSDLFADGVQWTPFLRFARSCDAITFTWQNVRTAGPDLEPTLSLAFMLMPFLER